MITLPNWFNQSVAQPAASLFRDGRLISTANIILAIVAFSFTVMGSAQKHKRTFWKRSAASQGNG